MQKVESQKLLRSIWSLRTIKKLKCARSIKTPTKLIEQRNEKLEKDIKDMERRRDEISEKSQKYDELNKALGDMNRKLDDGQRRLKAQKEVYDLVKK